jgi:DNA-binding response OmpR family regulator
MRALGQEQFACDAAVDGLEAQQMLESHQYDVVVTDLRMPHGHGHALAMALLAMSDRPAVVILTGVAEPRLVKDLIGWGVDCVEMKPVRFDLFAAKVKAIVDRRHGAHPDFVAPLISWMLDR